jgi:hypothetical protein
MWLPMFSKKLAVSIFKIQSSTGEAISCAVNYYRDSWFYNPRSTEKIIQFVNACYRSVQNLSLSRFLPKVNKSSDHTKLLI